MLASELIAELKERIEMYGDWPVIIRMTEDFYNDVDIGSVYADEDVERMVISDFPDIFKARYLEV